MDRRKFLISTALAAGALSVSTTFAFAGTYEDIIARGKVLVALDLAIPPSGMIDGNLKPYGSDVETAQLLADDWGVELEIVNTTGPTRIPNLQTNKVDIIISTLSITEDRKLVIDFSKPYAAQMTVLGAPKAANISTWEDVRGKAITVTRGTTQDTALTPMAEERGFTIVRYDDDATLVTAAVSGQAEIVCTSSTIVKQISDRNTELAFEPKLDIVSTDLAVGIRKGETDLKDKVDQWVTENLKNGKLPAIYKKYHGVDLPARLFE